MPTTRLKNALYRLLLPFQAPRPELHPESLEMPLQTEARYLHLLEKYHVLGASALLRKENRRAVLLCSTTHPEKQITADSMFRIASITKMATALAALAAVEEGLLDPQAPFSSYFSDLPDLPELRGVNLIHLLSHTSGLMDPPGMEEALHRNVPFPVLLSGCRRAEPGSAFRYSNLGFGLIGSLLEAVYQLPVSQVFTRKVFHPLQMNATLDASSLDPGRIVPISRVLPWRPGQEITVTKLGAVPLTEPDPMHHYGHTAGAMYVDLFSLERMMLCLLREGAPLLSSPLGRMMKQKHAVYGKISPTLSYGLGLLRIADPSLSESVLYGHQGFAYGCVDGAFWEEDSGQIMLFLNGGASEARRGRLGRCNYSLLRWALREEMPKWP